MAVSDRGERGEASSDHPHISIPRGGPVYLPNLIGSLTRTPLFHSHLFHSHLIHELEELREEVRQDSVDFGEVDLSVHELRILTEEELVKKAFDVTFRDDEGSKQFPELSKKGSVEKNSNHKLSESENCGVPESITRQSDASPLDDPSSGHSRAKDAEEGFRDVTKKRKRLNRKNNDKNKTNDKKKKNCNSQNNDKTRKRQNHHNNDKKKEKKRRDSQSNDGYEESYMAKVEELIRIKEKQLEDKAAAKLHSFDGSCRVNDSATISSETSERTTSLRSNNTTTKVRISNALEAQVIQPEKETVLCVEVYHNKRPTAKTQEFLVLGQQFLSELKDKIYCLTDQLMLKAGKHDTSGYFLIEDVFCNDLRDTSAVDYSKPILDWLKDSKEEALEKWEYILSGNLQPKQKALVDTKRKENLPRFKACQMQKTRFCDLNFRLGAGYLYCHQGDCKHSIVIRDMRLMHPEDVQNRFAYPVVSFQLKSRIRKCSVCQIFRAKLVTVDDKWAGENPCYFCDTCYYMLHYADQSLLYPDFSVYDYHHDEHI